MHSVYDNKVIQPCTYSEHISSFGAKRANINYNSLYFMSKVYDACLNIKSVNRAHFGYNFSFYSLDIGKISVKCIQFVRIN